MGIPRFYKFITEQFPDVSQQVSFKKGQYGKVDNLYLDANGIIHNCAHDVYFPDKPRLSQSKNPTSEQLEIKLFQAITDYMDQLLKFVQPKRLFYIAIDGTAPLAKQSQQRQRRYKAADEKTDEQLKTFDSTCITPGTYFMYKLGKYIQFYITKMVSTDPIWQNVHVIFSGSETVGEGEHKIVQYIREQRNKNKLVHCMYGLDADLFMLGLGTHCQNFYLLREEQFKTAWDDTLFYKVNIGLLRKQIFDLWGSMGGNTTQMIDDFIFICFLAGNDFLHSLPCCHDLTQSINFLMELRKKVLGSSYITSSKAYNLNNLAIFLKSLAETESCTIFEQYYQQNFVNTTLNDSLVDSTRPELGIDLQKYRELYYRKAGVDHTNQNKIWEFCKQYLQGLEWVQYYYHSVPNNWHWYFPYHYSPLVIDIVDYLTNTNNNIRLTRVSNKYFKPILPFQQLLCVVPPKSKTLLPSYLRYLYNSELKKYYPSKYHIDYEGKLRDWEGIAILPFIDLHKVIQAYEKAQKRASYKGLRTSFERNIPRGPIRFEYDPQKSYDYKYSYGRVSKCPVKIIS